MPIILNVPFAEKDQAKALGARWDPTQRKWYVADGTLMTPFERWLPEFNSTQTVNTDPAPKDQGTGKARRKENPSELATIARGDRIDATMGKVAIGSLYVDLSHDCIPWEPCRQCTEALAQRRVPLDPMLAASEAEPSGVDGSARITTLAKPNS